MFFLHRNDIVNPESDVQMKWLNAVGVMNEVEDAQSFLEYTKCWIGKQNRDGLKKQSLLVFSINRMSLP